MSGPATPWQDIIDLRVEAAVSPGRPMKWGPLEPGDNDARLNFGRVWGPWDVLPGDPDAQGLWVDISEAVTELEWTGGAVSSDTVFGRWEAAQMRAVFHDPQLLLDPTNSQSPLVSRTVPNTPIRIRAGYRPAPGEPCPDGELRTVFGGYVDTWAPQWNAEPFERMTEVTATDGTKILAAFDTNALDVPVGSGETASQRIHRILDHAGWPAEQRNITPGGFRMLSTDHAQPAWTELLLTADSDMGYCWLDTDGSLSYRTGEEIRSHAGDEPSVIFGTGGLDCLLAAVPSFAADSIRNVITASNGTVTRTVADESSVFRYRAHSYRRTDLKMNSAAQLQQWLDQVLFVGSMPRRLISQILMDCTRAPEAFRWTLVPDALVVWQVSWTPPGDGTAHTVTQYVQPAGWVHNVTADEWLTTVTTAIPPWPVEFHGWDYGLWDEYLWKG